MKQIQKILVQAAMIAVLGYAAACGYLYFSQNQILFPSPKTPTEKKFEFSMPFEEVWIDAGTAKLHGLYFKAETSRGLIVFFHGNAEKAEEFADSAPEFTSQGYDYFIPDYRGYGKSTGKIISEEQFLSDIDRLFKWALSKYSADKIILGGRSLGAVPAAYLAAKHRVKRTVLIAPFFNVAAMADIRYPIFPKRLVRYQFRNNLWVSQIRGEIDFIHGTDDKTIPLEQSRRLFELAQGWKQYFLVPGAGHNNLQDFSLYHEILFSLLNAHPVSKS